MPQKVLTIDDSRSTHAIVRRCLAEEPIELIFASGGVAGLEMASAAKPDLILLDVEMPTPDGFEVCRQLKADAALNSIPVIFLTGATSTAQKVRGLNLGATDYVTKPFDPAELCARVRASLRSKYMLDLLTHKAMIDPLTGLWNRAYLQERLGAEVALHRRHGSLLCAVMADVDRFKAFNDSYGHPFGDEVLRRVAELIAACCRREDVVCRYGGEEFAILTPGVSIEGARTLAERARQSIHAHKLRYREQDIGVTCSLGVAEMHGGDGESLLKQADAALYEAKSLGRNRVACAHAVGSADADGTCPVERGEEASFVSQIEV